MAEFRNSVTMTDKKSVFKATAGFMRSWEDPNIMLLAQYYYDGNDFDASEFADVGFYLQNLPLVFSEFPTKGHNLAVSLGFSKLFGCKDLSLSLLGITNFTEPGIIDLDDPKNKMLLSMEDAAVKEGEPKPSEVITEVIDSLKNSPRTILSATLNYSFNDNTSMGFGPYITLTKWDKPPVVSLKINFTLGGGKF